MNPVHATLDNSVNTVDVTLVLDDRKESEAHKGNQVLIKGRSYSNKVRKRKPRKSTKQKTTKTTKKQ